MLKNEYFQSLFKIRYLILFVLILPHASLADNIGILWEDSVGYSDFSGASFSSEYNYLPVLSVYKEGNVSLSKGLEVEESRLVSSQQFTEEQLSSITNDWQVKVSHGKSKRKTVTTIEVLPYKRVGNQVEVLISFDLQFQQLSARSAASLQQYASHSKLATGTWYKFGVEKSGVYKMDVAFFEKLGVKVGDISSQRIKVFGHKGGMLPELAGAERTDDIREIPILVRGTGENVEVVAYLEGPDMWRYDEGRATFNYEKNLYTNQKNYFITFEGEVGKRIIEVSPIQGPHTKTITTFDDYQHVEEDMVNLLASGRIWLGNEIGGNNQLNYNFSFPNIDLQERVKISLGLAAMSSNSNSIFQVINNNNTLRTISIPPVGSSYLSNAANYANAFITMQPKEPQVPITINYNRPNYSSKAWPDYINMHVVRHLIFSDQPLYFRSIASVESGAISQFKIGNWSNQVALWDVTDLFNVKAIKTANGTFLSETSVLREFVAFSSVQMSPNPIGKVKNQNLHALGQVDYLIIARAESMPYAREIGEFHFQQENLSYHVVDVEEIFNEFSSGNNDLSAIRNFVKMFYDRAGSQTDLAPKYLLLFGNGNYDNKDIKEFLIPSYQSTQSFEEVVTYVTDDYFGFLDDDEGDDVMNTSSHLLDIAIGRMPVDNIEKAKSAVDKIKMYYSQEAFGDWRANTAFIADDEDNNIHIRDTDIIANIIQDNYLDHNVAKIYLDAFNQQSVSGGHRYPAVNEAINNNIYKGLFYLNFVGHGGPNGLAHEKVVTFEDINSWGNKEKLFLFCTATCEFTRFDVPTRYSAGERVLMKNDGGAIALVSTTRLVFSDKNKTINENFVYDLFEHSATGNVTIGDVFLKTKNRTNTRENNRKFALFGDPALKLSFPKESIEVTKLLSYQEPTDTIKSLDRITIEGEVQKNQQLDPNFNGIVNVTVYDKMEEFETIGNDAGSPIFNFKARNSIIYRGRAKASGGKFELTFIVPKDINYQYGNAKISLYGENGEIDALGNSLDFIIGGVADSIPKDNEGPIVDVYIDNEDFVFGGIAAKNSTLYVRLEDESGINTSGTGLGHDITAILNEDSKKPIVLNAFYEEEVGDYSKGKVKYPFNELENGRHKISVKAWDVLNNSGEGYTEFIVEDRAEMALYYVLNYPNPFTTNTQFSFEHNRPGDLLDIRIEIYTVNGKLVKTLQKSHMSNSRRFAELKWDGLDEFGDRIGKGVYIYKVSVRDSKGEKAYKYQKLVLLR